MKKIPRDAYNNCNGLVNITIPATIEIIESSAFSDCPNLKSVSIPSKVTSIGRWAFDKCIKLESVVVKNSVPLPIAYRTFCNLGGAVLYVPKGCRNTYLSADNWRNFSQIREMTGVRGDVNQDGEVAVADVMMTVAAILGNDGSLIPLEFADMDGDGNISVGDVMAIVGIVLNK